MVHSLVGEIDRHTRAEWEARWGENMKEVPINQLEEEGDARNRSCDSQVFRECPGVSCLGENTAH